LKSDVVSQLAFFGTGYLVRCGSQGSPLDNAALITGKRSEQSDQFFLRFESNSGSVGHSNVAIFNRSVIGESAERLKDAGIGFVAAKPQASSYVQ
jgi:hypothetical protein